MAERPASPVVPIVLDENALAEDLAHHTATARKALDLLRREIDRDGGLPFSRLKRCEAEGRDGTQLNGCLKTYVPWPVGRYGLVLLPVAHPTRPLSLRAFAYGVRHPRPNKLSVYQIASDRRQRQRS
jgi:hypothetical protein